MKRTLALIPLTALILAGCGEESTDVAGPSPAETITAPTTTIHSLTDRVEVKNSIGEPLATISDIEITTDGCDVAANGTLFQATATVESNVETPEILWPSDMAFTDSEGMKVTHLDLSDVTEMCESDGPRGFDNMYPGDKRRASITLNAPDGAQTMIYEPTTIPDAQPVTWDIKGQL